MTSPAAGWYPDPAGEHHRRWWDGERWTTQVADDERPQWSGWTALLAIGAVLVGTVVAGFAAYAGDQISSAGALLGGSIGLYSTLLLTCWLVSRRRGTGRFRDDYGIRFEVPDWYRGLALMGLARLVGAIITVVLILFSEDLNGTNTGALDDHKDSIAFLLAATFVAVVLAPFFEELFFRGLLQRSLETVLPAPAAIGLQGVLFGLVHLGGAEGIGNVGLVAGTAVAGIFFGIGARRYQRLGPGMAGHAWFNLLPVLVLWATRGS